jgi:hypothetical protein
MPAIELHQHVLDAEAGDRGHTTIEQARAAVGIAQHDTIEIRAPDRGLVALALAQRVETEERRHSPPPSLERLRLARRHHRLDWLDAGIFGAHILIVSQTVHQVSTRDCAVVIGPFVRIHELRRLRRWLER